MAKKEQRQGRLVSIDFAGDVVQAIWTKPNEPEEKRVLVPGKKGMATCTWSDGSTFDSNVPNLSLESRAKSKETKVAKRPASSKKRSKKAKKAKPTDSADDESSMTDDDCESEEKASPSKKPAAANAHEEPVQQQQQARAEEEEEPAAATAPEKIEKKQDWHVG